MSLTRIAAPLLALLFLSGLASAQDKLVLKEGVLELDNMAEPGETPLYGAAYFSPYESLDKRVLAALELAKPGSTVYMSYYSISFNEYPKMFRKLRDRGVKVRLNLYEKEALAEYKKIDDDLIADGFDVELIPNLRNTTGYGSMHTKFTVVNNEIIVTGSANLSASASLANHEHVVVVQNKPLARRYKYEWYEQRRAQRVMKKALTEAEWDHFNTAFSNPFPAGWKGSSRAADLKRDLARVDRRTRNYNKLVQGWFSPEDDLEEKCRTEIRKAKKTVHVAMYTFVNGLVNDLVYVANKGVKVVVVADDHQMDMEYAAWVNTKLENHPNIRYVRASNHLGLYSSLHHKYAVIDGNVVLGGSYNWTGNATHYNDENLIVLHGKKIADRFENDFASMLAEYDPQGPKLPVSVPGNSTRTLFAVKIPFEVPRGFKVQVLVRDAASQDERVVELRHSRSTGENWLGSADLPRGKTVTWRVRIGNSKGMTGVLDGSGGGKLYEENADAHTLEVREDGLAQIVHDRWTAATPTDIDDDE
jgi:phosphatidylserine/phosphatidylglycerophosphate/cardiolipin synthase-like enzyme